MGGSYTNLTSKVHNNINGEIGAHRKYNYISLYLIIVKALLGVLVFRLRLSTSMV